MAKRVIFNKSEAILHKVCRPVEAFDEKLAKLLDDMHETLVAANGVGLAAPQVGFLRRLCIIDAGEGYYELINPEILETSGTQRDVEGCLSCPNEWGYVTRPMKVKFKAQDRNGNWYEKETEGLFARAVCHECDHLDGRLFVDLIEEYVDAK
ncbi:MAG: peptide deformylase [Oscillospiraceae bacterium]|nr:peptide deformylase [Oscillospiraceae bacterium]